MKTAILLSGHMRSFDRCLPTQHWHVFRHFPGADFFVSTVKDADSHKAELLRVKYPNARVEIEVVDEQPDCVAEMRAKGVDLPKEWTKGRHYTHEPYAISVHPQAVLRQLWQLQKCWELFHARGTREPFKTYTADLIDGRVENTKEVPSPLDYDVVIRCRPDLWFHSYQHLKTLAMGHRYTESAWIPWWGRFGGINDRFAVMGTAAAGHYFRTYHKIPHLIANGCPLHPESLLAGSLGDCFIEELFAEFSTLRTNGEMRGPEISTIDLARLRA
jgi:hypothetical protein